MFEQNNDKTARDTPVENAINTQYLMFLCCMVMVKPQYVLYLCYVMSSRSTQPSTLCGMVK